MFDACELCREQGGYDGEKYCRLCSFGNPCLGCENYDFESDTCISYVCCLFPESEE